MKLAEAKSLVVSAHVLSGNGQYERGLAERALITNACFLNTFIALEEFLEASFVHFATGRMSTARWRPKRFARPTSVEHANEMFIGFQRFMDWSTPDRVIKLANLYFQDGEPFDVPIRSGFAHLTNMKTVRNATAHTSRTTQASLDALYSQWTGVPTIGATPYQMLMASKSGTSDSFYVVSDRTVEAIMVQIANRS